MYIGTIIVLKWKIVGVVKDVEELKPFCTAGSNIK
jgi:hypothetical protein